ncbi:PilT domain protein [Candidatus Magnetobacterium bavaricum]|uniref:PilT domain protein n=1 Tax=Candidatus Magnetobacterium bavaricum TaxID=29290 RepID=A0A0F3GLL6_9BACT|nr:PilT domain protein [Candidatus Magnetobacterium bavaricum]
MLFVFVDTSALVAFFDKSDNHHLEAIAKMKVIKQQKIKLLMSDYIFDETVTMVLAKVGHKIAVEVGESILNQHIIKIVSLSDAIKRRAWEYFKRHNDKIYSFTDCTSFVLMEEKGISYYFSFDDDFKRAGFIDIYRRYL